MSKTLVYALHGFLGQASDWDAIRNSLTDVDFVVENLFSPLVDTDIFKRVHSFKSLPDKKIFLGYSLGGRLGLQILNKTSDAFDHYVFLSTNPGLPNHSTDERQKRLQSDKNWTEKITSDNWNTFLKEWNSQSVFEGSTQEPQRNIQDFDLNKLRLALTDWSLGLQMDFSELIRNHRHKVTWVVGERDIKYVQLAENLKKKECLNNYLKVRSGHRIGLDNADSVVSILREIIY